MLHFLFIQHLQRVTLEILQNIAMEANWVHKQIFYNLKHLQTTKVHKILTKQRKEENKDKNKKQNKQTN